MPLGTPGTTPNSAINANIFSKCSPAINTNIRQCGTVTQMNAAVMTPDEFATIFQKSNDFRVMNALFEWDFEIKMCEPVQNSLYDFFMAQKVNLSKRIQATELDSGTIEIMPFIKARQYSPINNAYWRFYNGATTNNNPSGTAWSGRVASPTNIPADVNSFPVGTRVYIDGKSTGGSATRTAWVVYSATLAADASYITLILQSGNYGSNLLPYSGDKLGHPVTGTLRRGTVNVQNAEKFCTEDPAYINWHHVPFWVETTRHSMCRSSLYDKWRTLMLQNNPLYKTFFDLPDIEKNKQLGADWQRRMVDNMFWGKPYNQNQTIYDYDNLPQVAGYDGSALGLGADGGAIIARRANAVGIYEQLAECDRIADLQGGQLNLPALFNELYNMKRVREGQNHPNAKTFDIFTDSVYAEVFNQAMILYFKAKSSETLRFTAPAYESPKTANFGFNYRSYQLFWPDIIINIISHNYFDDWRAAGIATMGNTDNTSRVLWVLDFSGIYPGILASKKVVNETGKLSALAAVNSDFACVMEVPTKEQTLMSVTWTMVVECPMSNLILENFSGAVPEYANLVGKYPPTNTTTTSSTPFGG